MQRHESIIAHLERLFQQVREVVTGPPPAASEHLGHNAKGDAVKWFDVAADRVVCAYLEKSFPVAVQLLSEEGEPREFGAGQPEFTLVLDPVDGSENFSRGLPPSGVAIAVIPNQAPLSIETVQFALVGNLYSGEIWSAERGKGAFLAGRAIHTSAITDLSEALLSCDLNQALLHPKAGAILAQGRGVRACGAATLDLARVANGIFEAHLDLRHRLTPENFLASSLLIREAGGLITAPDGSTLAPLQDLTDRYSLIASANPRLHEVLVHQLGW
jgi:myo-inositol-1(or 4)-monophosphatase